MDTILRGYPTPVVFIRERAANLKTLAPQRDVVDGQQRLRTILAYIDGDLLEDYNEDIRSQADQQQQIQELRLVIDHLQSFADRVRAGLDDVTLVENNLHREPENKNRRVVASDFFEV